MHEEPETASPPGTWRAAAPLEWTAPQRHAALAAFVVLLAAGVWTLRPFLPALGWGTIFAVSLWPWHQRACARWPRGARFGWPGLFVLLILLAFVVPLAMVAAAIAHDGAWLAEWARTAQAQGVPPPDALGHLPFGPKLIAWWREHLAQPGALGHLPFHGGAGGEGSLARGERILGSVLHRALLAGFMLLVLFFLLRDGERAVAALRIGSRRAFGPAGENVAAQAVQAIRGTVNGLVIVGFGEGLLLGVVYALAGVMHPALFGLLTGLLSAVPLGAAAAVAGAAGVLAAGGQMGAAIAVAAIGGAVVFAADHFVRPALIGGSTRLPFLWVLLGILGGIEVWGLIGLVLGPALMAVLMLVWREWVGAQPGPLNPGGAPDD